MLAPSSTETAAANGDTRTLHLYHTHTGESIEATFRVDGHYDPAVLRQLNHFLRDWRNNDEINMDPRLFDAVWEAYRTAGATDPIQIYSAYRSPQTNAMLRRRSRAVAEHSQHMLGKAMDTTMPGFPMHRIREAGMKLQHGGVGWYPSANFVHLDVGGVRSWPRMSYDQLASIFPDGKTVHIAANGKTLPGYDQARAEIAARGGVEVPPSQESPGFFAWLFGNGGNGTSAGEGDEQERRAPVAVARATPPQAPVQQVVVQQVVAPPVPAPVQAEAEPAAPAPAEPTLAYAPSAPTAPGQLVAARARADGQEAATLENPVAADVVMPLPPRRPDDIVAAVEPDVPLPPARPDSLDRMETASIRFSDAQKAPVRADGIGGLITASASGVPTIRGSSLPAIITRGHAHAPIPNEVLAYAPSEPELRQVPLPIARPVDLAVAGATDVAKPLALRSARRRPLVALAAPSNRPPLPGRSIVERTETEHAKLECPKLMGLRRAAQHAADKASL